MPYLGKIVLTALTAAAFATEPIPKLPMTLDTLLSSGAVVQEGYGPRYSPGVMERVSRKRGLPIVDCMVSSPVYPIGTWVWVYGSNTGALEHCRVTDVSHPRDKARHLRTKRVAELGYNEAIRFCSRKHINHRPEQCPITVIYAR